MRSGLLVISHGSPDGSWVTLVDEAMAQAAWPEGAPIASSFLDCVPGRTIQDGIDELEAQGVDAIGVIPLFISGGSTHVDEIAYALGVTSAPLAGTKLAPFRLRAQVRYGRPLDGAALFAAPSGGDAPGDAGPAGEPEAGTVLLRMVEDRLRGLGAGPGDAALLVAHGSRHEPFAGRWHASLRRLARQLVQRGACAAASHALLCCEDIAEAARKLQQALAVLPADAGPGLLAGDRTLAARAALAEAAARAGISRRERRVAVVPVFLSTGYFTARVIPERLGDVPALYDGRALLPHPALVEWLSLEGERLLAGMKAEDGR
ncbi:hypothetical protein E2R60_22960 [Paenibacillus dendritiformis]|nr:CbiX/SirB N-terminal domain-containing protein [Paenibacillus dendritiformis]TDL50390.1 hypothetical protein E2R60_22960 [Paenibacillus dendritiformis]